MDCLYYKKGYQGIQTEKEEIGYDTHSSDWLVNGASAC